MEAKQGSKQTFKASKVLYWTIKKSWEASPRLVLLRSLLAALHGLLLCVCCFSLWWGTDSIIASWSAPSSAVSTRIHVLLLVGALCALYLLMKQLSLHLGALSRFKISLLLQGEAIHKATELDLADIESAGKTDLLQKRRGLEHTTCGLMDSLYATVELSIELSGVMIMCSIIGWPSFAAAGILIGINVLQIIPYMSRHALEDKDWRESYGRLYYIEHLLSHDSPAKEVRLFGLAPLFITEYLSLARKLGQKQNPTLRWTMRSLLFSFSLYGTIIAFGYWIINQSASGNISPGLAVMSIVVMLMANLVWSGSSRLLSGLKRSADGINAYEECMSMCASIRSTSESLTVPARDRLQISFQNVSLTYVGEERAAVEDITLTINPGDRIALVGENGSGKTTFVKLLTRLYDPTSGRVTVDGKDLKAYNVDEYRGRFGVIFQDFMRYHGSVRENIGYAQHERMGDRDAIENAVLKGGAQDVVKGLANGYDTKLGSWYEKGTDLSDGQWQKLALARAFFRECDILVLDEPTSVIDARAEYQIFKSFMEITEGKTTVMVSHRFSTVRMVDKIFVFKSGRIVEQGSHTSLMAQAGLYAELFSMQAEGYVQAGERDQKFCE